MNGDKENLSDLISRFKVELRQDKKKTTMLVILLIVGGIVGGRFVVSHDPPDSASAAGSGSGTGFKPVLRAGNQGGTGFKPVPQVGKSRGQTQQVDLASVNRTINRDLFWPNTRYFPPANRVVPQFTATQPDQAQQQAAAKQREHLRRMEHIKSIRDQAEALCLTSIMLGRLPTALINGQVLRTGEMINGFRLKSISSDCCVITREDVDVELKMRK